MFAYVSRHRSNIVAVISTIFAIYFWVLARSCGYTGFPKAIFYNKFTLDLSKDAAQLEQEIFHYMKQTHVMCHDIESYGSRGEGGWYVCQDAPYIMKDQCQLFSAGVCRDWRFEADIVEKKNCEVHAFDPSPSLERPPEGIELHNIGIWEADSFLAEKEWTVRSLESSKTFLKKDREVVDYLKIDIEGAEFKAIGTALETDYFAYVKQLAFEMHFNPKNYNSVLFEKIYNLLSQLEARGFRKYAIKENPGCKFQGKLSGQWFSSCMQLYYVNTAFIRY